MSNRNAFLAIKLNGATWAALEQTAHALEVSAAKLLGTSDGVGFDPVETQSLHMTFLFFGKHLRELPAEELLSLHTAIRRVVSTADQEALRTPMAFLGFELFPPEKMNLVVARFEPSSSLLQLREAILQACREHGLSLPSSFYALIAGEGAWTPHVTLGKIRASREELGRASCSGDALFALRLRERAHPRGLTLLGEKPPRAWCDWDEALSFGAMVDLLSEDEDGDTVEENEDVEENTLQAPSLRMESQFEGSQAWLTAMLESPELLNEVSQSKFQQFDINRDDLLEFSECSLLCKTLADYMCIEPPEDSRLLKAFRACCRCHQGAMMLEEFKRFFAGFLRSCSEHKKRTMTPNLA